VSSSLLEEGRAALREGDAAAARRAFELARAETESGEVLEGLGQALYLERDYLAAAAHFERAYAAHRREGRELAASRSARAVAWVKGNVLGDWAVQSGWFARARTLLEDAGGDGAERAWVLIIRSYAEPDAALREALLAEAVAIGRRIGDPDVEYEELSYLGAHFLLVDRADEGLVLLDEAMAAACAGELTEFHTVDSMFCGFFWACELVNDVPRADQWMRAAEDLIRQRNVVAAFCRAHYGGILTAAGRWPEAESELLAALRGFDRGMPQRRAAALIRLAELRLRQGRLEEAAGLLDGLDQHPDAVRTVAALHHALGETEQARDLLERSTDDIGEVPSVGESTMAGPLLALLVEVCLAQGDLGGADRAAGRLRQAAGAQRGPYLKGLASLATGLVLVARGETGARPCLQQAMEEFARAQLPMELARTRLEIARLLAGASPQAAVSEARAALAAFENLEATRHADAAASLLRELGAPPARTGPRSPDSLTRREREVLGLLGAGLSNPEIGDRLFITRKTVEHHVGSLLAKLGLRNRAEAAAYAVRENISP
jgi:DNA-binding CsgD family transcriptional regulator